MRKQIYKLFAMILLLCSMAVATQAQNSSPTLLRAHIPFEFNVGNKMLPAGDYTVARINPGSDRAVLQIRTADGRESAMVQMNSVVGKCKRKQR